MDAMMLQASSGHPDLAGPAAAAIELSVRGAGLAAPSPSGTRLAHLPHQCPEV